MDARSLVGMTGGAKRRAARRDAVTTQPGGRATSRKPAVRRHLLSVFSACWLDGRPATIERYAEARRRYRIGERLRPCPGCCGCNPGPNCPCSDATYCCNGSGTLPATRSRAATPGGADE